MGRKLVDKSSVKVLDQMREKLITKFWMHQLRNCENLQENAIFYDDYLKACPFITEEYRELFAKTEKDYIAQRQKLLTNFKKMLNIEDKEEPN